MITLRSARAEAVIDGGRGGRLCSLRIDGHEVLVSEVADPMGWGCFAMVPWAGRVAEGRFSFRGVEQHLPVTLGPHAIHGTGYLTDWHQVGDGRLDVELGPPWPYGGWVEAGFQLDDHQLRLTLEVHARDRPMPVMVGWHPWFRREVAGERVDLAFAPGVMYELDEAHIPTGAVVEPSAPPWDDCFGEVSEPIRVRWADAVGLDLWSDCEYWVVYTEPPHALCVEPQSSVPDAFNRQADELLPGQSFRRSFTMRWAV